MFRRVPIQALQGERWFRWRGGDVSRIEGITDAVIALAMTFVVVSLEVPETLDELFRLFRQLPAFAACFAVLVMCWYYHFQFHRRFGLENLVTVALNGLLLFLVLFYVYPLKFLFTALFEMSLSGTTEQIQQLMWLYGAGVIGIFGTFAAMHIYAYAHRASLELSEVEQHMTRTTIRAHFLQAGVGVASVVLAFWNPAASGLVYFLIPITQFLNGFLSGKALDRLLEAGAPPPFPDPD